MLHREYWGFNPDWLEYVGRTWRGVGRVESVADDSPERLSFQAKARESFLGLGYPVKQVKTWISVQVPESGDGYADQYPHVHYPLDGLTLVHYLQPGDKPAPLDIFDDGLVVETIYPEPGLTVFMPNHILHGARKNSGTESRIQMIATALRR